MDIASIPVGDNPPHEINVIIEIPQGGVPVKYEVDKKSGAMFVDRFLHTAMFYPANYGFIPHTLSEDGDPVDCLVVSPTPVAPGVVIRARPIGALLMEDEQGIDEKIIAVPTDKLHPFYKRVGSYRDLPEIVMEQIAHFFEHYKDLEKGKWAKLQRWAEPSEAADSDPRRHRSRQARAHDHRHRRAGGLGQGHARQAHRRALRARPSRHRQALPRGGPRYPGARATLQPTPRPPLAAAEASISATLDDPALRTAGSARPPRIVAEHPRGAQGPARLSAGFRRAQAGRRGRRPRYRHRDLPGADVKLFVTATPEERARRRYLELKAAGNAISEAEVLADIKRRDERDKNRAASPLRQAEDAVLARHHEFGYRRRVQGSHRLDRCCDGPCGARRLRLCPFCIGASFFDVSARISGGGPQGSGSHEARFRRASRVRPRGWRPGLRRQLRV